MRSLRDSIKGGAGRFSFSASANERPYDESEREECFHRLNALRLAKEEEASERRSSLYLSHDHDVHVEQDFSTISSGRESNCDEDGEWFRGAANAQHKDTQSPSSTPPAISSHLSTTPVNVQDVIELKLLIANQQSKIDALELSNRQLSGTAARLMAENADLASQLAESRSREEWWKQETTKANRESAISNSIELERMGKENSGLKVALLKILKGDEVVDGPVDVLNVSGHSLSLVGSMISVESNNTERRRTNNLRRGSGSLVNLRRRGSGSLMGSMTSLATSGTMDLE